MLKKHILRDFNNFYKRAYSVRKPILIFIDVLDWHLFYALQASNSIFAPSLQELNQTKKHHKIKFCES